MKEKNNRGFTLVELIIVLAIMAVLVGVLTPGYMKYVERSRIASDIAAIKEIQECLTLHLVDYSFAEVMECSSRKNWDWALYSGITLFQMNNGGKIAKGEYMQNNYSEGNFVYDSLNDSGMLNINFGHYFSNNSESFWKSKKLRRRDVTNIMFRMIVNTSATSVTCWIGQSAGGDTGTVVCEDGTVADVRCVGRTSKGTYVNYSEFLVGVLPSKSEASHDFQIAKKEGVIAQW